MKNIFTKRLFAIATVLILAVSVFAYVKGVEGKYKGSVNLAGLGALDITAELKGTDDKLTGSIVSAQGTGMITGGSVKDGKINLQLAVQDMAATIDGSVDDKGKITGNINGDLSGTIELTPAE